MTGHNSVDQAFGLDGRILYLTEDPTLLRRQLMGSNLDWPIDTPLIDGLSTDAIMPVDAMVDFDQRLGERVYGGIHAVGASEPVVNPGQVRAAGFSVCVSGPRRGRGSSREHAPWAEYCAGIRLIVAASFEHIYRVNCHNLGILTCTDYAVIPRLLDGESIPLSELTHGLDPITTQVVNAGGLFAWSRAHSAPPPSAEVALDAAPDDRPLTLGEKIIARHAVSHSGSRAECGPGEALFIRADLRVSHEYITPMAAYHFHRNMPTGAHISDPDSVLLFRDHLTFIDDAVDQQGRPVRQKVAAQRLVDLQAEFAAEQGIRLIGEQTDRRGSLAISHNHLLEQHALPGQLVISADSHAPTLGALGCLAVGVGASALAGSWVSGGMHITVPPGVRIDLHGKLKAGVSAKDIALQLLSDPLVRRGELAGRLIEWSGPAIADLGIDERATLTNMATDLGAFSSLIAPDAVTLAWLCKRGLTRDAARALCEINGNGDAHADANADAKHERIIALNLDELAATVALPGDPGNGQRLSEMDPHIAVDIAFGGSCTASKAADMDMYAQVLHEALARGQRVHPRVQFFIQLGSVAVREYCREQGHLDTFARAGAQVLEPGCGACCNAGPGVSTRAGQVTISAANRNYPGRNGPGSVYLGNPYTVAASAVAGHLTAYAATQATAQAPTQSGNAA